MGWHPGHFYSPIPSIAEVERDAKRLFGTPPRSLPGIRLNERRQLRNVLAAADFYPDIPYDDDPPPGLRYGYQNDYFSYGEAIILYGMMRSRRPKRIIEIGSGHSSCAILDANEISFGGSIACTFIDPHPERLLELLKPEDRVEVLQSRIQDIHPDSVAELDPGDILFVDSSHVSKAGSDVNFILFELLPRLKPGVLIHFHDVGYPFEYPREWIHQGRAWNEAYLLRAFLQFNDAFSIELINAYLACFHADAVTAKMPLFGKNPGTSLWISRTD